MSHVEPRSKQPRFGDPGGVTADSGSETAAQAEVVEEELTAAYEGRFELHGRSLRAHTARGVIINAAFQVGIAGLGLFRRIAIAGFLAASTYGIWTLLLATILTLIWLKEVGINDKYIE